MEPERRRCSTAATKSKVRALEHLRLFAYPRNKSYSGTHHRHRPNIRWAKALFNVGIKKVEPLDLTRAELQTRLRVMPSVREVERSSTRGSSLHTFSVAQIVTMFAISTLKSHEQSAALRGCEPLAAGRSLGVFHSFREKSWCDDTWTLPLWLQRNKHTSI